MPISRYDRSNVNSLSDSELKKSADKDDPEASLEGVAMAGFIGVLRQLGDLAEFAAGIFHDLHEEAVATAARGHGIIVRVQKIETEIPSIKRALLSQISHPTFISNSGTDWHPNQQISQNLITTGDLPQFVMHSYEECRGPPRLFLLDKFDVGGAGACLKRYTDPSVYKVEASSYKSQSAEYQRDKKIHKAKKKGSRLKGGENPDVSQPSHAKLHQLFDEEQVQTSATEPVHHVKLKTRPKKCPYESGSGESYMIKLLNSPLEDKPSHEVTIHSSPLTLTSDTSDGSSYAIYKECEVGPSLGSPMHNRSLGVSSSVEKTVCEYSPDTLENTAFEEEVDEKKMTLDEEIQTDVLQNGYLSDDVASDKDNYMDTLTTMDSKNETSVNNGTYSHSNKIQLQSQISDSQLIENSAISDDGSIKKRITPLDYDTTNTATDNVSPVSENLPLRPFACIEIPFHPRVPPVGEKIPVTRNPHHDILNDTYIAMGPNVDHVATLGEGTLKEADSTGVCSNHSEKLDRPRKSEERQIDKEVTVDSLSEHSNFLPTAGGLPSFSFVENHKRYQGNKYPNDMYIPMIHVPNVLETMNNQVEYSGENHSTGSHESQCSSPHLVNSRADEQPFGPILTVLDIHDLKVNSSDATFVDDILVAEGKSLEQLQEIVHGMSYPAEARVSYSSERKTESDNSEIVHVTVSDLSDANGSECNDCSVLKEVTELEVIETELEGSEANSVYSDMVTSAAFLVPADIDKPENNSPVSEKSNDNRSVINQLCIKQDSKEVDEKEKLDQLSIISPDDPNNDVYSFPDSTLSACDDVNKDDASPYLNSKILLDRSHSFLAETDQKQEGVLLDFASHPVDMEPCDNSKLQLLYRTTETAVFTESDSNFSQLHTQLPPATESSLLLSKLGSLTQEDHKIHIDMHLQDVQSSFESYSVLVYVTECLQASSDDINISDQNEIAPCDPESNIFTEVDHDVEPKSMNHGDDIDILEAPQSSPPEDKVDKPNHQLDAPLAVTHLQDLQSSPESYSVPVSEKTPTMELMQEEAIESISTTSDLEVFCPSTNSDSLPVSTISDGPEVTSYSTVHKIQNFDTENQISCSQQLLLECSVHTEDRNRLCLSPETKSDEILVPQAAIESVGKTSDQETFWPSSYPRPLSPIVVEMENNLHPMKIRQPRSQLIDAVTAHDKTKLRKVSDLATSHIPKREESGTILDQIREKSFNLKPAVQTRPSIQGPNTNFRLAAILEKAHAIRQAFVGSDDDDSDSWSDE